MKEKVKSDSLLIGQAPKLGIISAFFNNQTNIRLAHIKEVEGMNKMNE
jgi:hypothetical protein